MNNYGKEDTLQMISKSSFCNEYTINIFSDASIMQKKNGNKIEYYIGSPGVSILYADTKIGEYSEVYTKVTNNFSEIRAIFLAVWYARYYRNTYPQITNINIFSDSKISIFGLRDWMFKWINNSNDGVLMSTSGVVKNQEHFIKIIKFICDNDLSIRFYHVRGHHDHNTMKELINFRNSFKRENHIYDMIDDNLVKYLIRGNSDVDYLTRKPLRDKHLVDASFELECYGHVPITYDYKTIVKEFDVGKYKKLILGG